MWLRIRLILLFPVVILGIIILVIGNLSLKNNPSRADRCFFIGEVLFRLVGVKFRIKFHMLKGTIKYRRKEYLYSMSAFLDAWERVETNKKLSDKEKLYVKTFIHSGLRESFQKITELVLERKEKFESMEKITIDDVGDLSQVSPQLQRYFPMDLPHDKPSYLEIIYGINRKTFIPFIHKLSVGREFNQAITAYKCQQYAECFKIMLGIQPAIENNTKLSKADKLYLQAFVFLYLQESKNQEMYFLFTLGKTLIAMRTETSNNPEDFDDLSDEFKEYYSFNLE